MERTLEHPAEPTTDIRPDIRPARPGPKFDSYEWILTGRNIPEPAAARARIFARVVARPRSVRPRRARPRRARRTSSSSSSGSDPGGDEPPPALAGQHLHLVPDLPPRGGTYSYGCLTAEERGADVGPVVG